MTLRERRFHPAFETALDKGREAFQAEVARMIEDNSNRRPIKGRLLLVDPVTADLAAVANH